MQLMSIGLYQLNQDGTVRSARGVRPDGAGASLQAAHNGAAATCVMSLLECTCERQGNQAHTHYFAQCDLFRQLVADSSARLDFDGASLTLIVTEGG